MNKLSILLAAAKGLVSPGVAGFLLALCPALFQGCQTTDGGTEIPNELRGRERIAGGGYAADAEVNLIPVGHVPGENQDTLGLILSTRTDAEGRFSFSDVPKGRYNILAENGSMRSFRDSVFVTGKGQSLSDDTLRTPGRLAGTVRLQPQHNPRTATVQVMGTQIFVNVEADGSFKLADLGPGQYRLRVITTESGYTPLFADASVSSGAESVLPRPLEPFYSGIPVVEGLTATPRPDGTILVSWKKSDYPQLHSYVVARDDADEVIPRMEGWARVSDTSFVDTIYSRIPRAGQFPYHDTIPHGFEYRVTILAKSGTRGPFFDAAVAVAIPPYRAGRTGTWKPVTAQIPFARRWGASLVPAQGRLWMIGGRADNGWLRDAWSSADGLAWELATDSLPFQDSASELRAVALRDSLFVVRSLPRPALTPQGFGTVRHRLEAWISGDGKAWRRVADSLPMSPQRSFELVAAGGEAWILAGYGEQGSAQYWRSSEGSTWSEFQGGFGPRGELAAEGMDSTLFVLDSAGISWSATAGGNWSRLEATSLFVGINHRETLVAHAGRLWFVVAGNGWSVSEGLNQVWSSGDGTGWTLVDVNAAFGSRERPAMASFDGKLWLLGGEASGTGATYDGWYLEEP